MNWQLVTNSIFILLSLSDSSQPKEGATPPLIPRKILLEAADYYDVSLSPDGKWMSWIADVDSVSNVWVKEIPEGRPRNLTFETGRGIYKVTWLFDNRTLVYWQDTDGNENWRLYTLDVETAKTRLITDIKRVQANILATSIKFPDRLIIGLNDRDPRYHDAYDLNITTGNKTLMFQNDYFSGYKFDEYMQIRLLTNETEEGGTNYYKYENETITFFRTVNLEDVEMVNPLDFDRTGKKMYWMDNNDKEDLPSLYEIDWTTYEKRLIYKPKKAEISEVVFNPITKKPVVLTEDYAKPERILLDKHYEKDFEFLKKQLLSADKANVWRIHSYSYDFNIWVVAVVADTRPTAYYYYRRNHPQKNVTFMFYSKQSLLNYTYAPMRPMEIPIADNLTELCYLTLPLESVSPLNATAPVRPMPMILDVHGGPWLRNKWGYNVFVQFFANRGYAVLQCNFRSSTGYGKKFSIAGYGQWGRKMQQDLTDAVKWAIKKKIADPAKVAIHGGSYGGYAALAGLTFTPDLYACGVDSVGPSNLVTLLRSIPSYWKPAYNRMIKRIGAGPETEEGQKFLKKVSPLFYVDKIKRPLLIGQGANDPRVNRKESDQLVVALNKSHIPVMYVVFPNEGHGFVRNENRLAFSALTEQFLKKYLGGRAEPLDDVVDKSSASISTTIELIKNYS